MVLVAESARARAQKTDVIGLLDDRPLAVTIYYFSDGPIQGDVDNIVKPILDAMKRIAYLDDNTVERVVVQKFGTEVEWDFSAPSDGLAAALDNEPPLVYVRVDDDLSWRRL